VDSRIGIKQREIKIGTSKITMRFCQIDQITHFEPGVRIEAIRTLREEEDYLRDHFPRFAVMPGVLMLEALTQAAVLIARASENYQHGLVFLHSAKNVKFSDFVQPGQTLRISAEIIKRTDQTTLVKATGTKEDSVAVSGRLLLKHEMLGGGNEPGPEDLHANAFMKQLTERLRTRAQVV
jgi:3-hydroxyacyl-[acyl-carrier-protein] dehydratase